MRGAKTKENSSYGGIAQLGERLNGIQEVSGSIPLISTKKNETKLVSFFFFAVFRLNTPLVLPGVNKKASADIFWEAHADKERGAKVPYPAKVAEISARDIPFAEIDREAKQLVYQSKSKRCEGSPSASTYPSGV